MNRMIRCAHCGRRILSNPRLKEQRYCSQQACQRARKTRWQREKMATDLDYQLNQRDCRNDWNTRNPGYWRRYRSRHPDYVNRNRLLQRGRDRRRRDLAKMDLAKMDALSQKVYLIPTGYTDLAKKDSIDSLTTVP
ncbi:MAG: hypothetical protein JRH06_17325 [Deltaproteobacteria bacterium]|nr:hypothetical protein [Deltaproteobacteria bacterium]